MPLLLWLTSTPFLFVHSFVLFLLACVCFFFVKSKKFLILVQDPSNENFRAISVCLSYYCCFVFFLFTFSPRRPVHKLLQTAYVYLPVTRFSNFLHKQGTNPIYKPNRTKHKDRKRDRKGSWLSSRGGGELRATKELKHRKHTIQEWRDRR